MSSKLTKSRSLIQGMNTYLKQGKLIPAVQALIDGLKIKMTTSLMKAEKDQFHQILEQAIYQLGNSKELKEIYPLIIKYEQDGDKELLAQLQDIMTELQEAKNKEIQEQLGSKEKMRKELIAELHRLLGEGQTEEAQKKANAYIRKYPNDTEMRAEIADIFLQYKAYREALGYLIEALKYDPEAVFLYNRIGIVLRKLKDFKTSEKYFKKALEVTEKPDEYIWFNIGRLYYDMKDWKRMDKAAAKAIQIKPDFAEALKMQQFAQKKIQSSSAPIKV